MLASTLSFASKQIAFAKIEKDLQICNLECEKSNIFDIPTLIDLKKIENKIYIFQSSEFGPSEVRLDGIRKLYQWIQKL